MQKELRKSFMEKLGKRLKPNPMQFQMVKEAVKSASAERGIFCSTGQGTDRDVDVKFFHGGIQHDPFELLTSSKIVSSFQLINK